MSFLFIRVHRNLMSLAPSLLLPLMLIILMFLLLFVCTNPVILYTLVWPLAYFRDFRIHSLRFILKSTETLIIKSKQIRATGLQILQMTQK